MWHSWFYRKTEPFSAAWKRLPPFAGGFYESTLAGLGAGTGLRRVDLYHWKRYSQWAGAHGRPQPVPFIRNNTGGTSYDYMDNYMTKLSAFVADSVPEKCADLDPAPGFTGSALWTGFIRVVMVDPKDRKGRKRYR